MIFKLLNLNSSFGAVFADPDDSGAGASPTGFSSAISYSKTKFQKLKQFGSNNQTIIGNVAGGIFVAGGLSAVGVGVGEIYSELSKAHVKTFSPETSAFHLFFNNHSSVISAPGALSHLQDPTFVSLVKDDGLKVLFDALAQNKPEGIGNLLKDYNFHNLLQIEGFKELLGNQASLTTLLDNAGVFTEANIPLINTLMGNENLRTLFENQEFVALLQDPKFVEMLTNGKGLAEFYNAVGTHVLIPENYLNVLNNPELSSILQSGEIQNLLVNPEMLELMKNPGFTALYNDPALVNLLANQNLQAVMMNPEFVSLLGNPEVIGMLNNPEIMNMVSSPEFLNMINKPGFFEMIQDQEKILAAINDPALQNYINAANEVGVTPEQIAGAVSLMVGGIALALIGAKLIGTGKSKELENSLKDKGKEIFELQNRINQDSVFVNQDFQTFRNVSLKVDVLEKLNQDIKNAFEASKTDNPEQNVKNLTSVIVDEIYNKLALDAQEGKDQGEIKSQKNNLVEAISKDINNAIQEGNEALFGLDENLGTFIANKLKEALGRIEEPRAAIVGGGTVDAPEVPAITGITDPQTKFTAEEIKAIIKAPEVGGPGGDD